MCGIFGVVVKPESEYSSQFIRKTLSVLAKQSESRGKDSSGLAFRDPQNHKFTVYKGAIPIHQLLADGRVKSNLKSAFGGDDKSKPSKECYAVMGHSRLVTNGSQLHDENNQPVIKDGILGIHNGIIVNDAEIWNNHTEITRAFDLDTEALLALFKLHIINQNSFGQALNLVAKEVKGTFSNAFMFEDIGSLVLATNNGSLYTLTNNKDLLVFASEKYPLSLLHAGGKLGKDQSFDLNHISPGNGVSLDFSTFDFDSFCFDFEEKYKTISSFEQSPYRVKVTSVASTKKLPELVLDVAHIAIAPEAASNEAMLEYNVERVAALKRCSKCVLPETFPFIVFDEQGVCNYCYGYKIKNQPKPIGELLELIKPYRRTDGQPDCIVPFSGGRDSTMSLHLIKEELGLNPIAFTYDWGMVTDLGRRNIARVCGKLKVENIIVAADIHWKRHNINKNISAWLNQPHLGMIPLFMAGDKYFYYYADQVKKQTGIDLNIWGINPLENTDFKVGFIGVPPDFEKKRIYSLSAKRQLQLFKGIGGAILSNPGYINGSIWDTAGSFVSRSIKKHKDYFHLFDYYRWDENEIDSLILDRYEWEKAIDTDTTWRIGDGTAAFYNYVYYNVAGFSEHDTFRSNQIREGMLTRENALKMVDEENRPRYATIKWYTDVVQIDYQRAIKIINQIPKLYS